VADLLSSVGKVLSSSLLSPAAKRNATTATTTAAPITAPNTKKATSITSKSSAQAPAPPSVSDGCTLAQRLLKKCGNSSASPLAPAPKPTLPGYPSLPLSSTPTFMESSVLNG